MDHGNPVGGQWNFDQQNRRAYDQQLPIPEARVFDNDVSDIVRIVRGQKIATMGEIEPARLSWPITRGQSCDLLNAFVDKLLPGFGTYQDAMTEGNWHLFHSRLSFAMNTRMLHPQEVIDAAILAWQKRPNDIELPQVEGFVRQILGWREYMQGIYIDAIQWMELPNTRAMSQYADGGRVATKPYVSTARYIRTMRDYCDACAYKWNRRYGEGACPFNSLYWDFFSSAPTTPG